MKARNGGAAGLASAKEDEDGRAGAVALGFVDVAESPGDER